MYFEECLYASDEENLASLKEILSNTTNEVYRKNVLPEMLENVTKLMYKSLSYLEQNDVSFQVIAECFRILRNCCAGIPHNQDYIASKTSALKSTQTLLATLLLTPTLSNNAILCIQTAVQFLGNMIVNNKHNQELIWDVYSDIFGQLLSKKSSCYNLKIGNYSAMVIHNILMGFPEKVPKLSVKIHQDLIELAIEESEFALCVIQRLLENDDYIQNIYLNIQSDHRLFLLDTAHSLIMSEPDNKKLALTSVIFFANQFKTRSDSILKTVGHYVDNLEPAEVARLLEIIASASGNITYLEELQKDGSLLINCAFLLQTIHIVGKSGENSFTSVQRLADLTSTEGSAKLETHPAFSFKCGLVRLLGNLCWKHRVNQDKVRELDCIPVLLDCCNMDARNPLIIQWVVMGIRNLCEGNLENQQVIAAMARCGTVSSAALQEMGLTLNLDGDNKISIVPLK